MSRFENILSIIINPSGSVGFYTINLVWVSFTSNVDNSDALRRSSWSCFISAMSYSVKPTIANGDRPLDAFTKAALLLISDAVQYLFTVVFTNVGYSGTSASS